MKDNKRNLEEKFNKQIYEYKIWSRFREALIYTNRFFPNDDKFLDLIDRVVPLLIDTIEENSEWYRAREFEIDDPFIIDKEKCSKEEREHKIYESIFYNGVSYNALCTSTKIKMDEYLSIYNEVIKEKRKSSIWGFNESESGMPPHNKVGLSRANPKYIPYLYLANDATTALAEARALPQQKFSVAKYRINKLLRVVNLSKTHEIENISHEDSSICYNMFCSFSTPSNSNEKDYLMSQFIAEYLKTYCFSGDKFDGVAFSSSRNEDGVNLTLFDDSVCTFLGSSIHEVKSIKVESVQLLPLPSESDFTYGEYRLSEENDE